MKLQQDDHNVIRNTLFQLEMEENKWKIRISNHWVRAKTNNKIIKQLSTKEAIRTLGVHMYPKLQWNDQFGVMKEKMIESIAKLNNTEKNLT